MRRAVQRLKALGFEARIDESALARSQRFAGDDETRLAALHRVADAAPSVALATRGGYGLMRLLDHIDWKRIARSVERGTRWVGYSDFTALQLGLLAHAPAGIGFTEGGRIELASYWTTLDHQATGCRKRHIAGACEWLRHDYD